MKSDANICNLLLKKTINVYTFLVLKTAYAYKYCQKRYADLNLSDVYQKDTLLAHLFTKETYVYVTVHVYILL